MVFHIGIVAALRDGRIWSATGLVAGPLLGALGAMEGRSKRGRLWLLVFALFIVEPFARVGYFALTAGNATLGRLEFLAYAIEVAVGIIACAFVARRFGVFRPADSTGR